MYPSFFDSIYFRDFIVVTLIILAITDIVLLIFLTIDKILSNKKEHRKMILRDKFTKIISRQIFNPEISIEKPKDIVSYEVLGDLLIELLRNLKGDFANQLKSIIRKFEYVETFSKKLKSKSFYIRGKYAEKLGFTHLDEARKPLEDLLKSEENPYVIKKAAFALSFVFEMDDLELLYSKLSSVKDIGFKFIEQVFVNIIRRFRELNNEEEMIRYLSLYEPFMDDSTKRALFEALGIEKVYQAIPIIVNYADSHNSLMRISVVRALGRMGGEKCCNVIRRAFTDYDWRVRAVAAHFAGTACNVNMIPYLSQLLFDAEPVVAINAAHSLLQFGKPGIQALENTEKYRSSFASEIARYVLEEAHLA